MSQCQIRKTNRLSEDNSENQEREPLLDDNDESRPSGARETCVHCRKKGRVYRKGQIKIASHIELPRWRFRTERLRTYSHHLFIVKVEEHPEFPDDETKVRLTFIERMREKPYTRETVENFDLNKVVMNIYHYKQPTFDEEESVRRAYEILHDYQQWEQNEATYQGDTKDKKYSFFNHNCEHFVMKIKTGACVCLMLRHASDTVSQCVSTLTSKGGTIARAIMRTVVNLADDAFFIAGLCCGLPVIIGSLASVCFFCYDLYRYNKLRRNRKLCEGCYRQRKSKVFILTLVSLGLATIGGFASLGGLIATLVASFVGLACYGYLVVQFKKMYTFARSCFPTRGVPNSDDVNLETTNPGDVITFTYYGLRHDGVVTRLTPSGMCVAHYALGPHLWSTREIVEEPFLLDRLVQVCDYANFAPYPREEVVNRARQRIGEKRFNTFTNRSSHFATWCKASKRERCGDNDWIEVFTWDEVKVGDAIELWMYGRRHSAIFAEISTDKKRIKIYHQPGIIPAKMVKSKWIEFNLKVNTLYTRSYSEYTCYGPDEIIKRAQECERNKTKFKNADEFIVHCKIK